MKSELRLNDSGRKRFDCSLCRDKVVVAGNSLGGYNSLALASAAPELVSGVVLLNGAGRFEDLDESAAQQSQDVVELSAIEAPGYASFLTHDVSVSFTA